MKWWKDPREKNQIAIWFCGFRSQPEPMSWRMTHTHTHLTISSRSALPRCIRHQNWKHAKERQSKLAVRVQLLLAFCDASANFAHVHQRAFVRASASLCYPYTRCFEAAEVGEDVDTRLLAGWPVGCLLVMALLSLFLSRKSTLVKKTLKVIQLYELWKHIKI